MDNIRFCVIIPEDEDNTLYFPDETEKYFYFHGGHFVDCQIGDKTYIVHTGIHKVYQAVFIDEQEEAYYIRTNQEWKLANLDKTVREGGIYHKLRIKGTALLAPGQEPDKTWEVNKVSILWHPEIPDPVQQMIKVDYLLSLFKDEKVIKSLDSCRNKLQVRKRLLEDDMNQELEVPEWSYQPVAEAITFNHPHRQLLMAIKTKPFVLLAGISGIGKSRLVRELAYKTCIDEELRLPTKPGNFELIKVKPDWNDSSEIIGHISYRDDGLKYSVTAFLRFVVKAWKYIQVPFFCCMDEMNLGRVEQYFAEYLSILETRQYVNGEATSDSFISGADLQLYAAEDPLFWEKLGLENHDYLQSQFLTTGITLPPNLIVIGTVNMDATTNK
jgi:hypothetical protein